mmetsp:Transcript_23094/g.51403  ORF Transcript_23094/g.51403 Transcript_23094/m.51403 type:complete len:228 (+) Transcript_23094:291-974(+)
MFLLPARFTLCSAVATVVLAGTATDAFRCVRPIHAPPAPATRTTTATATAATTLFLAAGTEDESPSLRNRPCRRNAHGTTTGGTGSVGGGDSFGTGGGTGSGGSTGGSIGSSEDIAALWANSLRDRIPWHAGSQRYLSDAGSRRPLRSIDPNNAGGDRDEPTETAPITDQKAKPRHRTTEHNGTSEAKETRARTEGSSKTVLVGLTKTHAGFTHILRETCRRNHFHS